MRRKSYPNSEVYLKLFEDIMIYFWEKPWQTSEEFWNHDDSFLKVRRQYVSKSCKNLHAKKYKIRFLMCNFYLLRLCLFFLKNKRRNLVFRKYISNFYFCKTSISNAIRSSNLMLKKSIFYDFLFSKNYFYSWYNMFLKRKFFFKKYLSNQVKLNLKKGCDLFILGDLNHSSEEGLLNFFVDTVDNVFDFEEFNNSLDFVMFFNLCIQHSLELYKSIQWLCLAKIN